MMWTRDVTCVIVIANYMTSCNHSHSLQRMSRMCTRSRLSIGVDTKRREGAYGDDERPLAVVDHIGTANHQRPILHLKSHNGREKKLCTPVEERNRR